MYKNSCIDYKMRSVSKSGMGLTKGAWSAEEDTLLKNCIEKYGEGKWHLVPLRAGLNRCRKSCRLRWLNYLRPNIKRGDFGEDEIDLMLRLHKLLGNRWSLIAGRIPGRTANDVKNYWNTHLCSHFKKQKKETKDDDPSEHITFSVIKPRPRTFSKTLDPNPHIVFSDDKNLNDSVYNASHVTPGLISPPRVLDDKINEYLDELFDDQEKEVDSEVGWSFGGGSPIEGEALELVEQEDGQNSLLYFPIDTLMWDFSDSEQNLANILEV